MQFLESKWWSHDIEGQVQWPPFSIPAEKIIRCIFGSHLVILAQTYYKLSCKQVKFHRILSQNGQNDLDGHGQWPSVSIPAESIPGCMFHANLVILAKIGNELSSGQAEFPSILSQNYQNDLEVQSQWPPFQIPAKIFQDKCLVQIWWFQLKIVTSYRAGNDNTPSAWKAKGWKLCYIWVS